jgi:hypothetical protein
VWIITENNIRRNEVAEARFLRSVAEVTLRDEKSQCAV